MQRNKYMNQNNGMLNQNMNQPQGNPYINQTSGMNNNPMSGNFGFNQQAGMGMGMQNNPYFGQNPYLQPQTRGFSLLGNTTGDKFLRGLLIGGAAAYILTNENAQKAIIKTGMKVFGAVAGGVEEFKEKIMDAKAELETEQEEK
ncbi:MAG: hypothetical protein RBR07_10590 [Arcobacteraceae bacterium]|jgi:hypothetical protein|nr:hypothetical protein [Arcobacteraceae bacterium]